MPTHEIKLKLKKNIEILHTDIEVAIKKDGELFGTLTLSKGSIDWLPTKKHIGGKNEISLSWTKFDKAMKELL